MNHSQDGKAESHGTQIQRFYAGQSVFITGGTGFLGKILIDKLLRSCTEISKIYLLIRSKKGKSPEKRLDEMFQISVFDQLREMVPNFRDKIVPVTGDCNVRDLGLSQDDKNLLIHDVSIVFHMGANIRLTEDLHSSVMTNVNATHCILEISKRMKKLKSFIHVSTIFSNCTIHSNLSHIDERVYTYPIDYTSLLSSTSDSSGGEIDKSILSLSSQWPNTYTFTKAIAESLVKDASEDLPIAIFRPSGVVSVAREPLVGWVETYYGPLGFMVAFFSGLLRFARWNPNSKSHIVPVDLIVNGLIVAAWDAFKHPQRKGDNILVYNYVDSGNPSLTCEEYIRVARECSRKYMLKSTLWLPSITLIKGKIMYKICIWFGHLLPALIIDGAAICLGIQERLWRRYKKIHQFSDILSFYGINDWTYTDDNVQAMWHRLSKEDRCLFNFNMKGFDWSTYLDAHFKGICLHLFKDKLMILEESRVKWRRLYWIHQTVKIVFMSVFLWIVWRLFANIL